MKIEREEKFTITLTRPEADLLLNFLGDCSSEHKCYDVFREDLANEIRDLLLLMDE